MIPKIKPSLLLADIINVTISRYSMAEFSSACGKDIGFVKMGNFISIPITNRKIILAGVFCLNRPITDMDYSGEWRVLNGKQEN